MNERLATGIPKLDEALAGGLEPQKSILLCASPGVEDTTFAEQALFNRLSNGDHGLYFVNNKQPSAIRSVLKQNDYNTSKFENEKLFCFFDAYAGLVSHQSAEQFSVKDPTDLDEITKNLKKAFKEMQNNNILFVFDSLSSLIDIVADEKKVMLYLTKWLKLAKEYRVTPLFLFVDWAYDERLLKKIRNTFDCIIDLKAVERKVILRKYFTVAKVKWAKKLESKDIPFKIFHPGGIRVYIPKLLITGPYNAGKTSFIHSVSTKAVSVDRLGTTVALDHGHVDYKGFAVDVWGTPGQTRFDPILARLGGEALGVIVVVDSTDPKGFARAKDMLLLTETEGLPSIVVANKSNLKGALKPDEIRSKMKLSKDIFIIPVAAKDLKKVKENQPCQLREEDIHKVLDKLFEVIV